MWCRLQRGEFWLGFPVCQTGLRTECLKQQDCPSESSAPPLQRALDARTIRRAGRCDSAGGPLPSPASAGTLRPEPVLGKARLAIVVVSSGVQPLATLLRPDKRYD